MEEPHTKKGLIIFITALITTIFWVGLYLLNDQYEWVDLNNKKNEKTKEEEKEEIEDLNFDNKAYLNEMINENEINVDDDLNSAESTKKEAYLNDFDELSTKLNQDITTKVDELKDKDTLTTIDMESFEDFLLTEIEDYNDKLANLSSDADFELSTIIVYNMPLSDYYYIDNTEGTYFLGINYAKIHNTFKNQLTEARRDYYVLKNEIYKNNNTNDLYKDAALLGSWNEFKDIILDYDTYVEKYSSETKVKTEYDKLFDIYIGEFTLDNTPIYEDDEETIKDEVLSTYKDIVDNHTDFSRYEEVKEKYDENK
ncbi:MAG: hypothetical protein WDA21_03460 [Bacilli bacterium]